jgi:hypothetical protein
MLELKVSVHGGSGVARVFHPMSTLSAPDIVSDECTSVIFVQTKVLPAVGRNFLRIGIDSLVRVYWRMRSRHSVKQK